MNIVFTFVILFFLFWVFSWSMEENNGKKQSGSGGRGGLGVLIALLLAPLLFVGGLILLLSKMLLKLLPALMRLTEELLSVLRTFLRSLLRWFHALVKKAWHACRNASRFLEALLIAGRKMMHRVRRFLSYLTRVLRRTLHAVLSPFRTLRRVVRVARERIKERSADSQRTKERANGAAKGARDASPSSVGTDAHRSHQEERREESRFQRAFMAMAPVFLRRNHSDTHSSATRARQEHSSHGTEDARTSSSIRRMHRADGVREGKPSVFGRLLSAYLSATVPYSTKEQTQRYGREMLQEEEHTDILRTLRTIGWSTRRKMQHHA